MDKMTKTDNDLRDELAEEQARKVVGLTKLAIETYRERYRDPDDMTPMVAHQFKLGWNARDKVLLERGVEFDSLSLSDAYSNMDLSDKNNYGKVELGARFQHSYLTAIYQAKLAKLESEKAEMSKHIGKLSRGSIVYGKAKALKEGGGK